MLPERLLSFSSPLLTKDEIILLQNVKTKQISFQEAHKDSCKAVKYRVELPSVCSNLAIRMQFGRGQIQMAQITLDFVICHSGVPEF